MRLTARRARLHPTVVLDITHVCEGHSPPCCHAERVRVFVRVRPTRPEETPGGLKIKAGGKGVVVYRE